MIEATTLAWSPGLTAEPWTHKLRPTMYEVLGNARDALGVDDPVDQRLDVVYQLNTMILERTILDEEPNGVDS